MYLNLKREKRLHLEAKRQRAPFTLKLSAGFGSSINWEPGHAARVVFVFPAIDETEIIGYCPRDLSFLRLQDFKGKRLFHYEHFITLLVCWWGGEDGIYLPGFYTPSLLHQRLKSIEFQGGIVERKYVALEYAHVTNYFWFFLIYPLYSPCHTQDSWQFYSNDVCSWQTAIISAPHILLINQ